VIRKDVVLVQTADARGALLRDALGARPELVVVAEVTSTLDAVAAAGQRKPDILVMDVGLEDVAGHGVLRSVRAVSPSTRIVLHARATDVDDVPGTGHWLGRLVDVVVAPVRSSALEARLVLSEETLSVPVARSFVSELLEQWDLAELVPATEVLVSELVANAVRHVTGPCALELSQRDGFIQVAVADSGRGMPDLQVLGPTNEHGRGLHIVSAFSTAWGVDHLDDGGKLVWAELASLESGAS
jgi:CheY-like chemotaxis protein/anti-sigma regulatory factor (Ser/Thr protein kinase)